MSKIDLASKQWCDLVFEGRNKEYGAYRNRANKGKFQLRAIIIVVIIIVAVAAALLAKSAVEQALAKNKDMASEEVTELQELKKDEPKKEEPKKKEPELEYEKPVEKVNVKSSIQFTVPKIVEDDKVDHSKELKTQDEVTKNKFAIAAQDYVNPNGDNSGINIDDLKENQRAGGTTVVDGQNAEVIVDPSSSVVDEYMQLISQSRQLHDLFESVKFEKGITLDGNKITIQLNAGLNHEDDDLAIQTDGIGLYRTEIAFMLSSSLPSEEQQISWYKTLPP